MPGRVIELPVGLWIIATPIGHWADLTPRARFALVEAHWILCEDTRKTTELLKRAGVDAFEKRLRRFDAHAGGAQVEGWIRELELGKSLAVVSDAGTPSIQDPGAELVMHAQAQGIRVVPIPGVSAVICLLSVSGFQSQNFVFRGFLPRKNQEKEFELARASSDLASVFVWFESPLRLRETCAILNQLFQTPGFSMTQARLSVGKEMTKVHEKIFSGEVSRVVQQVNQELDQEGEVGEWCLALYFVEHEQQSLYSEWSLLLQNLLQTGVSPVLAVKEVAKVFHLPRKWVYDEFQRQVQNKID